MKTRRYGKRKLHNRIISAATALMMLLCCLPVFEMEVLADEFSAILRSHITEGETEPAGQVQNLTTVEAFVRYARSYTAQNRNDTLSIAFGSDSTFGEFMDGQNPFVTMAKNESEAFNGKIILADGIKLNLSCALFGWVTDKVTIESSGGGNEIVFARTREQNNEPLFAKHVKSARTDGQCAKWKITFSSFQTDATAPMTVNEFAGFLGALENGAKVELEELNFNNSANKIVGISAGGDAGLACGTVKENAELTIGKINIPGGTGSKNYAIKSTGTGNAGALVGSIGNNAKLILGADLVNPQDTGKLIEAKGGFAGGIVGKCDNGSIEFNNSAVYTLGQVINGSSGAGGIAGYYKPAETGTYTVSVENGSKVAFSGGSTPDCKVNGGGKCGALFGEMVNQGDLTIAYDAPFYADHTAGSASAYGALIGKYSAAALSDSLTIESPSKVTVKRTGGTVATLGGLIGEVGSNSYVKLSGVSVDVLQAGASSCFGGLVGSASGAFVELSGTNTVKYTGVTPANTFAGAVGSLGDGVLYLQGTLDLSQTPAVTSAAETAGQVVGSRGYGLIFAASGWTLVRSLNSQTLDDVGSWGEIVRFGTVSQGSVLTVSNTAGSDHYVTLLPAVTTMNSTTDFVKTALNMQLNKGQTGGVLRCSGSASADLLASTAELALGSGVSIDLTGTGITSMTRDNGTDCVCFSGSFDGSNGSIKLATGESYFSGSNAEGNGKIYRHAYIGLFGQTQGAEIKNLTVSAGSTVNVDALVSMHVGNLVGQATGDLTLDNVTVSGAVGSSAAAMITADGTSSDFGGFVGNLNAAGTVSVTDCVYKGKMEGGATESRIGGLIGLVSGSGTFDMTFEDTTVGGSVNATGATGNEIGGVIAVIATSGNAVSLPSFGRTLKVNNLTIEGETLTSAGGCGGLLGHRWYDTDVEFKESGKSAGLILKPGTVSASTVKPAVTSAGTEASGLVNTATGYWKVNAGGIDIRSITVSASAATSFGLLVNKGYYAASGETWGDEENVKSSAIYLELAPGAFTVIGDSLTLPAVTVFDELVAYSANGNVTANGQGIVSVAATKKVNGIETRDLLKMGSSDTHEGKVYQHQTNYISANPSKKINPNTRYYYNLDQYRIVPSGNAQKFLLWSVEQYACKTLRSNFTAHGYTTDSAHNVAVIGAADTEFNMLGFSYYPVDVTGSVTIRGNFSLYNTEFDASQDYTANQKYSLHNTNQHYTLHNALFRNVSGSLSVQDVKLAGDVNVDAATSSSGALILGTVSSEASAKPAVVSIDGLTLDGIRVGTTNVGDDTYAPLLINKAGSNATITVTDLEAGYTGSTSKYSAGAVIASSLLGKIGTATSQNVNLTFSHIKLDGRNAASISGLESLNGVYHTTRSLFSRATLADELAYADYSGSQGIYDFSQAEDWGTGDRKVTYGFEISGTVENTENGTSKQLHYKPETTVLVNPVSVGTAYTFTNFQKYVYAGYSSAAKKHELKVNLSGGSFDGCGTYNDPYILTSGTDLNNIANIINGSSASLTICVPPTVVGDTMPVSIPTWCSADHREYTHKSGDYWYDANDTEATKLHNDLLREYLAGAYYKIEEGTNITLDNSFAGISNLTTAGNGDDKYVFRGVIDGSGQTITNQSPNPLIVASNGSVVYNLNLRVAPAAPKTLTQTAIKPFLSSGTINSDRCDAYGAVIGQIFGGDNIIDKVSVEFSGTVVNAGTAAKAYLVPIGGYVGVVVGGGLIFREMQGYSANNAHNQNGISAANLSGFTGGTGDATASTNTKWLYVNPIVGRVLNGYVVTESASYKPFEDGSRDSADGKLYWHETMENGVVTGTYADRNAAGKVGVTMRNGTKNYSIADINADETDLLDVAGGASGLSGSIGIPNAQAFYVMSLITNSGMGIMPSENGAADLYTQTKTETNSTTGVTTVTFTYSGALGYYNNYHPYYVTRHAAYTQVGPNAVNTAGSDYETSGLDEIWNTADKNTNTPYLIRKYTKAVNFNYPARAISNANNSFDILLTAAAATYYLPDGYRGTGNFLYGGSEMTDAMSDVVNTQTQINIKQFKSDAYLLSVHSFDGNLNTVNQNTSYYTYDHVSDNYPPYAENDRAGLGLFTCLTLNSTIENVTLTGSVKSDVYQTSGSQIEYTAANTNLKAKIEEGAKGYVVSCGSLFGSANANITINDVVLKDVDIRSARHAGGLIGNVPEGDITIRNTSESTADSENIKVHAGADAGGLIGYNYQGLLKVDFKNKHFKITEIVSETLDIMNVTTDSEYYYLYGVGGLVGLLRKKIADRGDTYVYTDADYNEISNIVIENYTAGISALIDSQQYQGGYNVGGMIGMVNRAPLKLNNCRILNVSCKTNGYAGGIVGWNTTDSPMEITNTVLKTDLPTKSEITGNKVKPASTVGNRKETQGFAGGFVGYTGGTRPEHILIRDCSIEGYTIQAGNFTGGVIGGRECRTGKAQTEIQNFTIDSCTLNGDGYIGGLIGYLKNKPVVGYNILANDLVFAGITAADTTKHGCIVGDNNTQMIQIAGYSRQGTIPTDKMVGNSTNATDEKYGGGYVVFADYNGTATTEDYNEIFSPIKDAACVNVGSTTGVAFRSKTTITDYSIIAKQESNGTYTYKDSTFTESYSYDVVDPELDRGEKNTSYVGSIMKQVTSVETDITQLTPVTALTDLVGNNFGRGFFIKSESIRGGTTALNKSFTSTLSNKDKNGYGRITYNGTANSTVGAAAWFFEKNEVNNKYKIYTYINGNKQYLLRGGTNGKFLKFDDSGTEFEVIPNNANNQIENGFEIHDTELYCLQALNAAATYYFDVHTDRNNYSTVGGDASNRFNAILSFYCVPEPTLNYNYSDYSSDISFDSSKNKITITASETPTPSDVTDDDEKTDEFINAIAAYLQVHPNETIDDSYVLVKIRQTAKENEYQDKYINGSPYVTTSPKYVITTKTENGSEVPAQWFTGDGVTGSAYSDSTAQAILAALTAETPSDLKRYQHTGIASGSDTDQMNGLESFVSTHLMGIKTAVSPNDTSYTYMGADFPVLVIDNRDTANTYLKNYLKLMTNTKLAFDATTNTICNVVVSKWVYSPATEMFELSSDEASLKYDGNFSINTTDADNNNWQISLVDVQFKDPSGTNKIAYHLYVPVIVKKMLHYYQMIRPSTGTVYDLSKYPQSEKTNLIDNLGNPVTVKLSYVYDRTAEEWENAINNGENVYRNYTRKMLSVKVTGGRIPSDAKIVLLDPNGNMDQYYYGDFSSVLTDANVTSTDTTYLLKLQSFTGFSDASIVKLNQLMTVIADDDPDAEKNLVVTPNASECTVQLDNGTMLRKARDGETPTHAVKVTIPEGSVEIGGEKQHLLEEDYYLSIFTKEDQSDTNIYHFELNGISSFGDGDNPSARIDGDVSHIFLGNLYDNSVTIAETNPQQELSENNSAIGAILTANVGFTENAITNGGICNYIDPKNNVHVYHTFLVSLNEIMSDGTSVRGIQVDPSASAGSYSVGGSTTDDQGHSLNDYLGSCVYSPGYIEIPSSYDILSKLKYKAEHPDQDPEDPTKMDYTIQIQTTAELLYDSTVLSAQFPEKGEDNTGTYMIGYSNLSSSQESGASSRASVNTDADDGVGRNHYYINNITSVDFSYRTASNDDIAFQDDGNGDHGQLGINANELDGNTPEPKEDSPVCTKAYFNASGYSMRSSANFVKIRVWLSQKSDYNTPLDMSAYFEDFKLLDKDKDDIEDGGSISVTESGYVKTYIVPISNVLQTASAEEAYSFIVPINFNPRSGKNAAFEGENLDYSNYRISVEMGLLSAADSASYLPNSNDTDFVVYTNARIKSDVITPIS